LRQVGHIGHGIQAEGLEMDDDDDDDESTSLSQLYATHSCLIKPRK
jgi:hypothetical protein